jgi:uncharacterized protein
MRAAVGLAVIASLLAAGPLAAQEKPAPAPRLYLTGKAKVEAPPDFASVTIGVTNRAATTAEAIDKTSAAAAKIVAAAKAFGIAPADLQTSYVVLTQAYRTVREPGGGTEQKPDGYQATNSVTMRVRDLGRLGEVLRNVVDSGANQIDGVDFGLSDPKRLEQAALTAAVKDARAQADTIATAAGVTLARIVEIRYGAGPTPVPPHAYYAPRRAAARENVPVEAGSLEVTAEVSVVFELSHS